MFKEMPKTKQGLKLYIRYVLEEEKRIERRKAQLSKDVEEARRRLEGLSG